MQNQYSDGCDLVKWAGRIPRHKIQRLYELDAQGIIDEELIDDVAFGFYARCLSILQATRAYAGVIVCPVCENEIAHQWKRDEHVICTRCSWQTLLATYAKTFLGKNLHGGSAMEAWTYYIDHFPGTQTPQDKMLLIDWLIHQLHQSTRSVAVQLIGGSPREVLTLLDHLAYGDTGTPGLTSSRENWRDRMNAGAYRASMPKTDDLGDTAALSEEKPVN